MADITEIRELARKLNLWNIARGYIDLNEEKLSNLDYLQMILHKELEIRARQKQIKLRRASKLPNKVFELSNLNKGLEWQIKQLSHLTWLNEEQNIILLGKCGTGKTSLAVHLGETAIDRKRSRVCARSREFESSQNCRIAGGPQFRRPHTGKGAHSTSWFFGRNRASHYRHWYSSPRSGAAKRIST